MAVNDQALQADPAQLLQWAISHEQAAEACAAARAEHPNTVAAAHSWGPMMYELRRATIDAVNAREAALQAQEQRHRAMAAQLRTGATKFGAMNAANTANLTIATD
ncbi:MULTISPECIES: type VII secretion target [Mycobacterium]|jgi:hypothetical protein|uniref:type VII secretion target n=1 Tax=Mycobacterium TaxID=1763 RepID=UPI000F011D4C|nr:MULTISPECIES: type VII secretion target [Mycobacterium]MDP7732912.1 type VII secretion target [Mycobacterium sp. TY813]VBA34848.1 hypothetical protein LAUMK35_05815 [Mycobacterium pseudokansasii]VBA36154.1 hypothetical protein LAUMK21_05794 [Mycobacterium pseudokansasii]